MAGDEMCVLISGVGIRFGEDFMATKLPSNYRPTTVEPFMNAKQREFFRRKLVGWREEVLKESQETLIQLQEDSLKEPDVADRASSETEWSVELRTRDRQRKLVSKIDGALTRLENGGYGYCEVTGEPISLQRLDARPIATMSVESH